MRRFLRLLRQRYCGVGDKLLRGIGGDRHVGAMVLDRLEGANWLAELLANLGILDRMIAGILAPGNRTEQAGTAAVMRRRA